MNKQEAISYLQQGNYHGKHMDEAVSVAISALQQQLNNGWIPVDSRMPEENEYREQTTRQLIPLMVCENDTEYPFRAFFDGKHWGDGISQLDVIAWQSLPESYKEPPHE